MEIETTIPMFDRAYNIVKPDGLLLKAGDVQIDQTIRVSFSESSDCYVVDNRTRRERRAATSRSRRV